MANFAFTKNVQPPAKRLIASRANPCNAVFAATQAMVKSSHTSMTTITDIALVFGNYYTRNWNGGTAPNADTAPGAAQTITASIEYPAGTLTQIKFSGIASGTIPDGDILVSDSLTLAIPNNTQFWVRSFHQCSAGICHQSDGENVSLGELTWSGNSGITDQTMVPGAFTNTGSVMASPMAIIGTSTVPAIAIIGTSIAAGVGGDVAPTDNRHGFQNWLTAHPNINLAVGSANLRSGDPDDWIANHHIHAKMIPYCTTLVTDHGTNDYIAVSTAQCILNLQTRLYPLFVGKKIFQTTILPRVPATSDGFLTVAGQSGTNNLAGQQALNRALRAGFPGFTGLFDTDALLESGFETGWWTCTTDAHGNAAPFTGDGTHPKNSAQYLIRDSGTINQALFL